MAELKRSNSLLDIEHFMPTLPQDRLITVYRDPQYYYVIEGYLHAGTLTKETILFRGDAGDYFKKL